MPLFIDEHKLGDYTKEELEKALTGVPDEYKVSVRYLFIDKSNDKLYCVCESPDKEAIIKHHRKYDVDCDSVTEIESVSTPILSKMEKLSTVGELAARISHDIRNPLSIIKNSIELIKMTQYQNLNQETKEWLEKISRATQRINHQVENTLDYVNPKPLKLEKSTIRKIISDVIEGLVIPKTLQIEIIGNVEILCDIEKIQIVFVNLITNAIQVMNGNGKIIIQTLETENEIKITVTDTGPGIPADKIGKIFDPLFTTRQIGTGLGLTSCKTIIEQHGGSINVETEIGKYARFIIRLPK